MNVRPFFFYMAMANRLSNAPPCRRLPAVVTSKPVGFRVSNSIARWNPVKHPDLKKRRANAYELENDAPIDLYDSDFAGVRGICRGARRWPGAAPVGRLQFAEKHLECRKQVERRASR